MSPMATLLPPVALAMMVDPAPAVMALRASPPSPEVAKEMPPSPAVSRAAMAAATS